MSDFPYYYAWGNNEVRKPYKGKKCRVLARGKKNTIQIEFECGHKMITSGNSIRKQK
jgi:hypothetical protein